MRQVRLYKTASGNEVVRDFLRDLTKDQRQRFGEDLYTVQLRHPLGMPLVEMVRPGLWALRSTPGPKLELRALFCQAPAGGDLILLHVVRKKTRKLPPGDIEIAEAHEGVLRLNGDAIMDEDRTKLRSTAELSTFDELLAEDATLDDVRLTAAKRAIALQVADAMAERGLSKTGMAQSMQTSRAQLDRLLDPSALNVTLDTLVRAARSVGRELVVSFVQAGSRGG